MAVAVIYILFNFFYTIFVLLQGGTPHIENGQKVLTEHGTIIRYLSEDEYRWCKAYTIRAFSGHWMVFYGASVHILSHYLRKLRKKLQDPRTI